ncbi:MAG UNVERIFIED_CONTAM: hypothetical protein LVT10_13840 [Anaerolineae bacterium]
MKHLRARLQKRQISLILDFIPNHMATDSNWLKQAPRLFIQGTPELHAKDDLSFLKTTDAWEREVIVARGRDPYFPAWIDTAQLNAFHPDLRQQVIDTLLRIATICDGVRCDMAMLMTNVVFHQTWGWLLKAFPTPPTEYWCEVISAVKAQFPSFIFIAEVYWNMESQLLQQGFHYTYDKRLYDRLLEGNAGQSAPIRLLTSVFKTAWCASLRTMMNLVLAPRLAMSVSRGWQFWLSRSLVLSSLFMGSLKGRKLELPVQSSRAPQEVVNPTLKLFYRNLFKELHSSIYTKGIWRLFDFVPSAGFPYNVIAHGWVDAASVAYRLIVVNVSGAFAKGIIPLKDWRNPRRSAMGIGGCHAPN